MKSPRHRWNWVAQQEDRPFQADGLYSMARPDAIAKELRRTVRGKSSSKAYLKALLLYEATSSRYVIEGMLFSTMDVDATARVLSMSRDHLQVYADCFFDLTVFEDDADKVLYLDRYAQVDISGAEMMRNIMGSTEEQLQFLADTKRAGRVSPKDALEEGLALFYNLMKTYIRPQLEEIMASELTPQQEARIERLFRMGTASAKEVRGFTDQLLKYELDKSSENFLEEFALALTPVKNEDLFKEKPKPEDGIDLV